MTGEQFAYWLHGFTEGRQKPPTAEQWRTICDRLVSVVDKDGRYLRLHTGISRVVEFDDEDGIRSTATGY